MLVSTWWQIRVITKNLNKTIVEDKGHVSGDDPLGVGWGRGKGTGWAKGLLIRKISEESPISNIKDESDRSEDDPRKIRRDQSNDRSQGRKVLRLPRRSEDRVVIRLDLRYGSITWVESRLSIVAGDTRVRM